jgi:hypothetical protein
MKAAVGFMGLPILFILLATAQGSGMGDLREEPVIKTNALISRAQPVGEVLLAKAVAVAVPFVKNAGQFSEEVLFTAGLFSGNFFLTENELVYSLSKRTGGNVENMAMPRHGAHSVDQPTIQGVSFREYFVDKAGKKIILAAVGEKPAETVVSYLKGSKPEKWISAVPAFSRIALGEVYPGIEVDLKANGGNVEKIFTIGKHGKADVIRIGVQGADSLGIDAHGRLILKTGLGDFAMRAPVAWQEIAGRRCEAQVYYRLVDRWSYGFDIRSDVDPRYPLFIDPELDTLICSTCLGGTLSDEANSLVIDGSGNVFVVGTTHSNDFPTTDGVFDGEPRGDGFDVFISKFDASLSMVLASTFLQGSHSEWGIDITLDDLGHVYVAGLTLSADFPTTVGAFDRIGHDPTASYDVFVSKLDNNLSVLLASTFLGGNDLDWVYSLIVDGAGSVYLTGSTESADFPSTEGVFSRMLNGESDGFIAKLNWNLSELQASTFLGGSNHDGVKDLVLDNHGDLVVLGNTSSADFPVTALAYDRAYDGEGDVFIAKLDNCLSGLLASTFLGGSRYDSGQSLLLDPENNVVISGDTGSLDFPRSTVYGSWGQRGVIDGFVAKLDASLSWLLMTSFLGGSTYDLDCRMAFGPAGEVFLSGRTNSKDFPTTSGAYEETYENSCELYEGYACTEGYVAKLSKDLTCLLGCTYLMDRGSAGDFITSLAADGTGCIYVGGRTLTKDFPTTPGAFAEFSGGDSDAFVAKLGSDLSRIVVLSPNGLENLRSGTAQAIIWKTLDQAITDVRIELTTDKGLTWSDVSAFSANNGYFEWNVPDTPSYQCFVKISDAANPDASDTSNRKFSIIADIQLSAERRELRTYCSVRYYGQVEFKGVTSPVVIQEYRLLRRKGNGDFEVLRKIAASEIRRNRFSYQDMYLEKNWQYTYLVEAYDAAGRLVGSSAEKMI